mmetsp:Transcript_13439/g.18542  ORF Transcript_13439/g.18542 Transcript_13439/m.18542 type:complete len:714 (-) Transcript_13439:1013-3154(-)
MEAQLVDWFSNKGLATFQAIQSISNDRKKKSLVVATTILLVGWYLKNKKKKTNEKSESHRSTAKKSLSKDFVGQLLFLLKIVLPGVQSKEFFLLILHIGFLVSRTFLSIYVADLDGVIVKSLVDRNGKEFVTLLFRWLGVAIPATYVNSMIKYLESKLAIAFRTRLTQYAYDLYMEKETYYRVLNLDSRISNADQCLTEDISKFCSNLAHLHSQLSKPMLDVIFFSWQLWRLAKQKGSGGQTVVTVFCWSVIYITAQVLKLVRPNYGKLVAEQAALEGDLRYVHSRLITNSEEVAFYGGDKIEKGILFQSYYKLVKHMNFIFRRSIFYNMMEGFLLKYVWSAVGLLMIAIPAFLYEKRIETGNAAETVSNRTRDFVTSKQLLISGADAVERIMLAFKEVTELAGYTSRVYEMIRVFHDVQNQRYQKVMLKTDGKANFDLQSSNGKVIVGDFIKFEGVPIVSPNGDKLVESLSFEIKPGMHLLITGPNGCGKSSLFRILGGLWPAFGGVVTKPANKDMFYIPQRPYLPLGALRDQVIYPDTIEDMKKKGITDKDLEDIFGWVNLKHILEREGGWNATNDWKDVLSGGEKQRIAMARLFYHKPKYAILDECTSAVSIDVEGRMYQHAIDLDITLLTVTHRPTLWKYHEYLLQFDGQGGWNFSQLNASVRMSLKEEKNRLESQLQGIPTMQKRLKELCELLGEDSIILQEAQPEAS